MQRLKVGALCERLHRQDRETQLAAAIQEATYHVKDEFEHGLSSQIPLAKRSKFSQSEIGEIFRDEVRFALALDQGFSPEAAETAEPDRLITVHGKRPKGLRKKIIANVAEAKSLPEWLVDECWKDFRWYLNSLDD